MEKCLGVSKNLFLASEHVFKLSWRRNEIQYSQDTMWRSGVLHVVLSLLLLIEDSKKLRLSRIFKSQKHVLRLGIDSLRPQNTFPYPDTILGPLEQLWKIIQNHHLDFYCILPSERLQKGQNRVIFGFVFCDFLDSGSWYQKSHLGAKQPSKVQQKTL